MSFYKQLEVLSKLRDVQEEVINQIEHMPIYYDLETDIRYLQGKQKGAEEGVLKGTLQGIQEGMRQGQQQTKMDAVKGLLKLGVLTVDQIASALSVSAEFVRNIQAQLPGPSNA